MEKLWKQKRGMARKILRARKAEDYFLRFGPLYPNIHYHDRHLTYRGVCLTRAFSTAYLFAKDWKAFPDHRSQVMCFEGTRRFRLDARNFPPYDTVDSLVQRLIELKNACYFTPGAILVIDGDYLEQHDLLRPRRGEEAAIAGCLPWAAVLGMLFVDNKRDIAQSKVSSFLFGNNLAWRDLRPYLTKGDREFRIMLEKKDTRSSSSYDIYRRGYDSPRLRSSKKSDQ
jgi:hypothetical protein